MLVCALAAPADALANTMVTRNWAGYAVHRSGVTFRYVSAKWRQPRASCVPGSPSFTAFWVGLGGFSSSRLEQTGTEVDCGRRGHAAYYAWYELVPSSTATMKLPASALRVRPGDMISASVAVTGRNVTISLQNDTRHQAFRSVVEASALDASSAEWVVEAPCSATGQGCAILPLGDFRSVTFRRAEAAATGSPPGSISDPFWQWTRMNLHPPREKFVAIGSKAFSSAASSSVLHAGGGSFRVRYSRVSLAGTRP